MASILICFVIRAALANVADIRRAVAIYLVEGPHGWHAQFTVPAERREALMEGLDEIDVILRMEADTEKFQRADRVERPWIHLERG